MEPPIIVAFLAIAISLVGLGLGFVFPASLESAKKEIHYELANQSQTISSLNAKLSYELVNQSQTISSLNAKLSYELANQSQTISSLNAKLSYELANQSQTISSLNAKLNDNQNQINSLQTTIMERQNQISSLTHKLSVLEQNNTYFSQTPFTMDLVGWWPADGNTNDNTGKHNGIDSKGLIFVPGITKQAFYFDGGVPGFIDVGSLGINNVNIPFTISAWIRPNISSITGTESHAIVSDGSERDGFGNGEFYVFFGTEAASDGMGRFKIDVGSTHMGNMTKYSLPVLSTDKWAHVAVTYDGSNSVDGFKLYFNGTKVRTAFKFNGQINGSIPRDEWAIASQKSNANYFGQFLGSIDEVKIFSCALPPLAVQEEYLKGDIINCQS